MPLPNNVYTPSMDTADWYTCLDGGQSVCSDCIERAARETPDTAYTFFLLSVSTPEETIVCDDCGDVLYRTEEDTVYIGEVE